MPWSGASPERSGFAPGVRLGPYEILAPLGSSGMGEVRVEETADVLAVSP
jgi:hypothetical protein